MVPGFIENIDVAILGFFQSIDVPILARLSRVLALFGDGGIFWILLAAVLAALPQTRKCGVTMLLALLFSLIITNLTIKPLVARPRPYDLYTFIPKAPRPDDFSFPSGHTSVAFAGAVAFALCRRFCGEPRGVGRALVIFAAAIGISRVVVLVHYPSDVAAGAVIGTFCGLAAALIVTRIAKAASARRAAGKENIQ